MQAVVYRGKGEIFELLLGTDFYEDLKAEGYEFGPLTLGE